MGGLVRSSAVNDLLDPVMKLGGPPKEFKTLVRWLNEHAEVLAGSPKFAAKRFDVNVNGSFQHDGVADRRIHQVMARKGTAWLLHQGFEKENFRTGKNSQLFSLSREFGELCVDQPESKHIP